MDSRIEILLDALINDNSLPEGYKPMSRNEAYLYALLHKGISDKKEIMEYVQRFSDVLIVNVVKNTDDEYYSADKTFTEIAEAYKNGKYCVAIFNNRYHQLIQCSDYFIKFTCILKGTEHIFSVNLTTDIWSYATTSYVFNEYASLNTTDKTIVGAIKELHSGKIALPKDSDGEVLTGQNGQFIVSNGDGTTSWLTVVNGNEVMY